MRIIEPSTEILFDLDKASLATRIEICGRLCYKSEDKITDDSNVAFVEKVVKLAHNSVLEMGVFTLKLTSLSFNSINTYLATNRKYLFDTRKGAAELLITGSVRAFREYCMFNSNAVAEAILTFLKKAHPLFYKDVADIVGYGEQIKVEKVRLENLQRECGDEEYKKHRHVAVRFICNRAVTHEIVRHRPVSYLQESQRYCRYDKAQFGNEVTFIKPMFFEEGTTKYQLWFESCKESEQAYLDLLSQKASPQASRTVLPNSCKTEIIMYCNLTQWQHFFNLRIAGGAEPSMRELTIPLHGRFIEAFPGYIN